MNDRDSTRRNGKSRNDGNLSPDDRSWLPRWIARYRQYCGVKDEPLRKIDRDSLIAFWRDAGNPAWQRLPTVRALENYRETVLRTVTPDASTTCGQECPPYKHPRALRRRYGEDSISFPSEFAIPCSTFD